MTSTERTGHPVCTKIGCSCEGDVSTRRPSPSGFVSTSGHAICACHSEHLANQFGVQRFSCAASEAAR